MLNIHEAAQRYLAQRVLPHLDTLRATEHRLDCGTQVIDVGCHATGGFEAGVALSEACLGGLGQVSVDAGGLTGQLLAVRTDHPMLACMASQYAGWPVSVGNYFAMGSGPMRSARGKEKMLLDLELTRPTAQTLGVFEASELPTDEVAQTVSKETGVAPSELTLLVARTASLAGTMQIVARSIETSMHKLHELGFDLRLIESGYGTAPIPPIANKDLQAMGWTNDAILYGGQVTLWVKCVDGLIEDVLPNVPSSASRDFGKPFLDIFEHYERDFYKIDPHLFSPAEIRVINRATGNTFHAGAPRVDLLKESFRWS